MSAAHACPMPLARSTDTPSTNSFFFTAALAPGYELLVHRGEGHHLPLPARMHVRCLTRLSSRYTARSVARAQLTSQSIPLPLPSRVQFGVHIAIAKHDRPASRSLQYGGRLETSAYQHNTADYVAMYLFGMAVMDVRAAHASAGSISHLSSDTWPVCM